ncbi:type III-A CRISPR-associated RAMP protein Csm5 [uncultured Clostridium sp.]|uniref:type III-A CRISPR-associated RAMP protein Csm5 n=1 Tax=uncultured Clostridium sp. TaxID=59620 RepID=UPI0025E56419|nr:type III-A CRISPR-associated RAMP protein Csm5 [uncultured Clostridium sp.]
MNNEVLKLKIKTLAPISIADNDSKNISPYINAVLKDNELNILDIDKITELIFDDTEAFNKYLSILKNKSSNSRSKYKIDDLLCDKNINLSEVTKTVIPCKSNIRSLIQVSSCIKSKGKAYIPGSSLKGAIRTAILYNSMEKDELYKNLNTLKYKGNNSFVGQGVFRKEPQNIQSDIFKYMILRDALNDKKTSTAIYEARSINLYENKDSKVLKLDMRLLLECIEVGENFNTELIIKNKKFNIKEIINSINRYYEKVIIKESNEIHKLSIQEKNNILNEYNLLLDKIRKYKESQDGFIMRIGRLKGYFSDTVTVDFNNIELCNLVDKYKGVKRRKKKGEFPTTKWFVSDNNNIKGTFGWIEVNINE